jgi:exopolyphosphatase / guanosine-5'-triphosphate,3'-diphosphate pyrophosphatase
MTKTDLDLMRHVPPGFSTGTAGLDAGLIALGRRYAFDERHGLQVAKLAVSLFDKTAPLHSLGKEARLLLRAAAVLHDIGMSVSTSAHHRHSMHLIEQAAVPGLTPREISIIAQVARYHRKSEPSLKHRSFAALPKADRSLVEKLAAILRLGDALDREHRQNVRSVDVTAGKKTINLDAHGKGDLLLERWAVKTKAKLFERVFNRTIVVPEGPSP